MQHGLEQSLATPRWTGLLVAPPEETVRGIFAGLKQGVNNKRCLDTQKNNRKGMNKQSMNQQK